MSHWWGGNPHEAEAPGHFPEDEQVDPPEHMATPAEADREWVRNVAADRADQAWLLSDRDVWYPNPAYVGPPVPHPEDCCDLEAAVGLQDEPLATQYQTALTVLAGRMTCRFKKLGKL